MKFIRNVLFFYAIIFFSASCQDETSKPLSLQKFFDLKGFFEKEKIKLKEVKKAIKKASVNGKLEEKTVEGIDLEEELALFVDSDINKLSWIDKYEVDSIYNNSLLTQINYKAKEEQLKTNLLTIHLNSAGVTSIDIFRHTASIAAEMEQHLIYIPSKGYSIESIQQTSLSARQVLKLDVQFVY